MYPYSLTRVLTLYLFHCKTFVFYSCLTFRGWMLEIRTSDQLWTASLY
jgi:hypothetical protein